MKSFIQFSVECTHGEKLGSCYYATYYKVKILNKEIKKEQFDMLHKMGIFGYGQYLSTEFIGVEPLEKDNFNKYYIYNVISKSDSSD